MDKFQESSNQPRKNSKECYKNRETAPGKISLRTGKGIRYTVPSILHVERMADKQTVRFRVDNVYRNVAIEVALDGTVISSRRKRMVAPGEMEQIILKKEELLQVPDLKEICISVTEQN